MLEVKYVMVTNWVRHWDDLKSRWKNSTIFTLPIIKDGIADGPWPREAVTLFIKRTSENIFEKSWVGKAMNFRKDPNNGKPAIRFEVLDLREIDCPQEFKQYPNGWHLNKSNLALPIESGISALQMSLQPAFFFDMASCSWQTFEENCFYLLKLLGIHEIYKFLQSNNRGKADGFFKFGALSVLYDATLENDFDIQKETQVDNYVNQLKGDKFKIGDNFYTIKDTNKQVWIITRNSNVRHIRTEDHIRVKEIPYQKLIEVFNYRLINEIGSDELKDKLKNLE